MKFNLIRSRAAALSGLVVLAALVLAACQPAAPAPTAAPTAVPTAVPTAAPTATTAPTATVAVPDVTIKVAEDAKLGKILVDEKGMTLYMFTKDTADKSNCNTACLANWPALVTAGSPKAGEGVDASKLGSTALEDGRKIVTYNHMPLYYWVKDTKVGDTTGQNVGKVWFVVAPDGSIVRAVEPTAVPDVTVKMTKDATYGEILVDEKGMTLYMFTKDTADKSNCNAACLANWPALVTAGSPKAGEGVDASKLGSATLEDGRKIVTYNHMPLYYWVKDTKAGDTTGQNVGKVWFVVAPDGKAVTAALPASDPGYAKVPSPVNTDEPTINVAEDAKLGKILVDGKGMVLYLYKKDTAGKSNCAGGCLAAWPPLLTKGKPNLGAGVDAAKIGTAPLSDGTLIVTYDGMPLYYYVKDTKAGDTTGQGAGSVWYVVAP